jgi:hypothetical protein
MAHTKLARLGSEFEYVPHGADSGSTETKPGGPAPVPPRTPAAPKLRRG